MGPEDDLSTLLSRSDHLNILRYLRAHQLRNPALVIEHATALLGTDLSKNKPHRLSQNPLVSALVPSMSVVDESERLAVLEQLCLAALDVHDLTLAERCLSEIRCNVPRDSTRVKRLLGLCLESAGDLDAAFGVYDTLLRDNPSNSFALKRKYCLLKSQPGREVEAKEALNFYLEQNVSDVSAWDEMGKLCLDLGDYKGAIYAYEEVVIGCPLDYMVHCKLAEVYATVGGLYNLKLARKHMAQSLELNAPENNRRALFGLVAVSGQYLEEAGSSGKSKREMEEEDMEVARELIKFGAEKLLKLYKMSSEPLYAAVEKVLKNQIASL